MFLTGFVYGLIVILIILGVVCLWVFTDTPSNKHHHKLKNHHEFKKWNNK